MNKNIIRSASLLCAAAIFTASFAACSQIKKEETEPVVLTQSTQAETTALEESQLNQKSETFTAMKKTEKEKPTEIKTEKKTSKTSAETQKSTTQSTHKTQQKEKPSTTQQTTTKKTTKQHTTTKQTTTKPAKTNNPDISHYSGTVLNDAAFLNEAAAILNSIRAEAGIASLSPDSGLARAAALRAAESSVNFDHKRPDGSEFKTIFADCNITKPQTAAENLAGSPNFENTKGIIDVFMNSPLHKENILKSRYTRFGLALYKADNGYEYSIMILA